MSKNAGNGYSKGTSKAGESIFDSPARNPALMGLIFGLVLLVLLLLFALFYVLSDKRSAGSMDAAGPKSLRSLPLSSLKLSAEKVDKQWEGPSGLVIDDLVKLKGLSSTEKQAAQLLRASLSRHKVIAAADLSYKKKNSNPPTLLTIKVLKFDTAKSAKTFFNSKYLSPAAGKFYKKTSGSPYLLVESREFPKRIALFDRFVITSGSLFTLGDSTQMLFLNAYIKRIKKSMQSSNAPSTSKSKKRNKKSKGTEIGISFGSRTNDSSNDSFHGFSVADGIVTLKWLNVHESETYLAEPGTTIDIYIETLRRSECIKLVQSVKIRDVLVPPIAGEGSYGPNSQMSATFALRGNILRRTISLLRSGGNLCIRPASHPSRSFRDIPWGDRDNSHCGCHINSKYYKRERAIQNDRYRKKENTNRRSNEYGIDEPTGSDIDPEEFPDIDQYL